MSHYRALDMLRRSYAPKRGGREPFWRPEPPAVLDRVYAPVWSWRRPAATEDGPHLATLDANGAFLSAIASADFAHGQLTHTGTRPWEKLPGVYLIERHPWPLWGDIMSPLGGRPGERQSAAVWVTHPTIALLQWLTVAGYWPGVDILDSWTCAVPCRFRAWAEAIQRDRAAAIGHDDADRLASIKLGYSQAVQLFAVPDTSAIYRRDWTLTVHGQHAASMWRKAWRARVAGAPLLGAGSVDELTYPRRWVDRMWHGRNRVPAPPIVLDIETFRLGTFKVKAPRIPLSLWNGAVSRETAQI